MPAPTPEPAPSPPASGGGGASAGSSGIPPDLHVAVRPSAAIAPPAGAELDFVVQATTVNSGGSSDARVTVTLPTDYAVTRISQDRGPGCAGAAPTLTCDVAWINPSAGTTIWIFGTVGRAGAQSLTATVASMLEPELNGSDNTVTVDVPASAPATPPAAAQPPKTVQHVLPVIVKAPTIVGRRRVGGILRATRPTWNVAPSAVRYHWQLCSRTACAAIPGATALSIHVGRNAAGRFLRVAAIATIQHRLVTAYSQRVPISKR